MRRCATHKKIDRTGSTVWSQYGKRHWLMIIGGLLVIALMYLVFDWVRERRAPPTELAETVTQIESTHGPRFEFYSLLAEPVAIDEVPTKQELPEIKEVQELVERTSPETAATTNYMLQVASLRDIDDAQDYYATLTNQGFAAVITAFVDGQGATWYRVRIGPYDDRRSAEIAQQQLARQGVAGIIHKEDV